MAKYFELIYYFIAFTPGVTLNIFMLIIYKRYKNAYMGLFLLAYLGTSLLVLCYLVNNLLICLDINSYFHYLAFAEVISMSVIIWSATILILKIFYADIKTTYKALVSILSLLPVFLYSLWFFDIWQTEKINDIYYLIFILVLIVDCVLFLSKFRAINQNVFRKLGIILVCILSFFMVFFVLQTILPRFSFDTFPLFYLLITIQLILFYSKHFLCNILDEVFNIQQSFIEKYNITSREHEIIQLIQDGHSNASISKELFISEKTAANHIYNIYRKLNITSRFELICLYKK